MDTCNTESVFIRLFTACILFIYTISEIDAFNCYSCSYTISGDPSVTFECANQPWNATTGAPVISCTTTGYYCVTKVVYQIDRKTITSVDRGCRIPEHFNCGQNCCVENSHSVVCQYQCQGTTCNSRDVSSALKDTTTRNSRDVSSTLKDGTTRNSQEIDAFNCYSCSYTISGDPTVTFECANQPWNATTGSPVMPCTTTGHYCVTKVVYQRDRKTITSVNRVCGIPQHVNLGQNCCEENSVSVVCEYKCKGTTSGQSICNSRDVSIAPKDNTCGTAADIKKSSILTFLIILAAKVVF